MTGNRLNLRFGALQRAGTYTDYELLGELLTSVPTTIPRHHIFDQSLRASNPYVAHLCKSLASMTGVDGSILPLSKALMFLGK